MAFNWSELKIPRFYGLDLKTNVIDVKDGNSLDLSNVYQNASGVVSKRAGNEIMFDADETAALAIDEIGSATLSGTKYWFKFVNGSFKHATSRTGAMTTITPAPGISTVNKIFWTVLDNKVFWVDGTNALRFFDPTVSTTVVYDSSIYARPTVAPTSASGAGAFNYSYTVEKGYSATVTSGESADSPELLNIVSAATIVVPGNTGPQTLVVGDRIRVYSHSNATVAASKNVTPTSGAHANGVYETDAGGGGYLRLTSVAANYSIVTNAITDDQPQLYTELGVAINKSLPVGYTGVTSHYGRLVVWDESTVRVSKVSNPHSFPDDSAQKEAFLYTFGDGDGEFVQTCVSYRESLFVLKDTKIAIFVGIGPDDTGNNAFAFRRLETNGIGCIAPKSAVVVGEEGENILVFLSRQGFYATDGTRPVRIGENIETLIQGISAAILSNTVAIHHKKIGFYLAFIGADASKAAYILDTRKDEGNLVGWFKWTDVNAKVLYWDDDRYIFGTSTGFCGSERVAGSSSDFSDIKIEYVAAAAVNAATEEITVANSYATGDQVVVRTNGTIPAGLVANTTYFVIRVSATVIKLATSAANATAGTAINITSQGVGTHSIVGSKAISAYYTTNWINFKAPSHVKKLGKPAIIFNALASTISMTMTMAYDWAPSFMDAQVIGVTSSHAWGGSSWGVFAWGQTANATPRNVAIPRRKVRSIRYKFLNDTIGQDFNLQAIEQAFDVIRNRGNYS